MSLSLPSCCLAIGCCGKRRYDSSGWHRRFPGADASYWRFRPSPEGPLPDPRRSHTRTRMPIPGAPSGSRVPPFRSYVACKGACACVTCYIYIYSGSSTCNIMQHLQIPPLFFLFFSSLYTLSLYSLFTPYELCLYAHTRTKRLYFI